MLGMDGKKMFNAIGPIAENTIKFSSLGGFLAGVSMMLRTGLRLAEAGPAAPFLMGEKPSRS